MYPLPKQVLLGVLDRRRSCLCKTIQMIYPLGMKLEFQTLKVPGESTKEDFVKIYYYWTVISIYFTHIVMYTHVGRTES
jgi:hypothetical protein